MGKLLEEDQFSEEDDVPSLTLVTDAPYVMTAVVNGNQYCFDNLDGPEGLQTMAAKMSGKISRKGKNKSTTFSEPSNEGQSCEEQGYTWKAYGGKKGGDTIRGELGNKRYAKLLEEDQFSEEDDVPSLTLITDAPYVMTAVV